MKIYEMTATFGKLDHARMTLKPGLNVIHAPNEWGKSTWCAFLMAMLYGLDTRARSTQTSLADKEHYAPWSGQLMSGSMDLSWQGRNITIERRTRGRTPMGEFLAYETETGMKVPELTAANCGQMLLGVEQSVFRRAGFIRLSDLPVTRDEALRSRLNALVTTGDESGDGETLAKGLKELKNKVHYNQKGLIPQLETRREEVTDTLEELDGLAARERQTRERQMALGEQIDKLNNHREHLAMEAAAQEAAIVAQAREELETARKARERLDAICGKLPVRRDMEEKILALRSWKQQWSGLVMEQQSLPRMPEAPEAPALFRGMTPQAGLAMAKADGEKWKKLKAQNNLLPLILGGVAWAAALVLLILSYTLLAGIGGLVGVTAVVLWMLMEKQRRDGLSRLSGKYGNPSPERWVSAAESYGYSLDAYALAKTRYENMQADLERRTQALKARRETLCGAQTPEKAEEVWLEVIQRWDSLYEAKKDEENAASHYAAVKAMAKPVVQPGREDTLTCTEEETLRQLGQAEQETRDLQTRIGQIQGRMEALGSRKELEAELEKIDSRLSELRKTEEALSLALSTLDQAKAALQRRFSPRIAKQAQAFMSDMTGGRYDRLMLGEDLSIRSGAEREDTLRSILWRSEGTVDQLYLALRLSVAKEVTPEAPLILDDAFVRFDDDRLKAALELLRREAGQRQILLFTCQTREQRLLEKK